MIKDKSKCNVFCHDLNNIGFPRKEMLVMYSKSKIIIVMQPLQNPPFCSSTVKFAGIQNTTKTYLNISDGITSLFLGQWMELVVSLLHSSFLSKEAASAKRR